MLSTYIYANDCRMHMENHLQWYFTSHSGWSVNFACLIRFIGFTLHVTISPDNLTIIKPRANTSLIAYQIKINLYPREVKSCFTTNTEVLVKYHLGSCSKYLTIMCIHVYTLQLHLDDNCYAFNIAMAIKVLICWPEMICFGPIVETFALANLI